MYQMPKFKNRRIGKVDINKLTALSVISAMAFLLTWLIRFQIVPVVGFLRYDPKDIVITIGGFLFGPLAAAAVTTVVALIQMFTISQTGPWGLLMNIVAGCSFSCTAAFIYSKNRTFRGAVIGLLAAIVVGTATMMLWNYLIVPIYNDRMTRDRIVPLLMTGFLPFNLIKNSLNAVFTMLLYKYIKIALQKASLMPPPESTELKGKFTAGVAVIAVFFILYIVLWIAVFRGWV
jgi:riboflavin transporter FmnP